MIPIKREPYKIACTKCDYTKIVGAKYTSDANPFFDKDFISHCPKCGAKTRKLGLDSIMEHIIGILKSRH